MNTLDYVCRRKPDGCGDEELKWIGDFSWRIYQDGTLAGMAICLPNLKGNGMIDWLPVSKGAPKIGSDHSWGWDGNLDSPTLTPSLHLRGEWHGFLTAGRLVSC